MRIILVAPVEETVPPIAYGGIEQVVHLLDEDLSARGHQVTLLASGGSKASSRLVPLIPNPLGRPTSKQELEFFQVRKDQAARCAASLIADERPDIVLNHSWRVIDYLSSCRSLTTVHFPLDVQPYSDLFRARKHATYVSISDSQRRGVTELIFAATVYNGIDVETFPFSVVRGQYLAFLGRVAPEKGLDIAIRVAQKTGIELKVAAKVDLVHRHWFDAVILPLVRLGGVELIGEISTDQKGRFLSGAMALLHPSRWNEPFGLAAAEAMACGTPVLALDRGAATEIVEDGRTGFVVDNEDDLTAAVGRLDRIDRAVCRAHVAFKFDRQRMAEAYEKLAFRSLNNS